VNRVLVTGANGFVGQHLCPYLIAQGFTVRAALRRQRPDWAVCEQVAVGDITAECDWRSALEGVEAVFHLAGRAHVMHETVDDPLVQFRQVNVAGSRRLAQQAAAAGVKRLIYLSSIKVNGERSINRPIKADDVAVPEDPYGQSKWEAEQALRQIAEESGMALVIVRPVLIYGRGVKGNLQHLAGWVRKGLPLPLGRVNNRRSLVSIQNLLDFLHTCLLHPAAAGEVFIVADGEDLSTPQLIRKLAAAMGVSPRLVPLPVSLLHLLGRLSGRSAAIERLCGNLQVNIDKNKRLLNWIPKVSIDSALQEMFRQAR
jgi:nucleoside-diphosphate-sugar epimerase